MGTYIEALEAAIQQYVGQPVLNRLRADPANALQLSRQLVEATILFTDIRSLNDISKGIPQEKLFDDLNVYFERMSEVIIRNNGFVDSLIGDSIFAIFGIVNGHHADDACNAAVECLRSLEEFNARRDSRAKFETGIGINSGKVMLGNIGSKHKLKFTAVGDNVNLASRMESLTKEYHRPIIITEYTKKLLTIDFKIKELDGISVIGLDRKLIVYSLQA
jgi:adenylate cyclase